MSWEKVKFSKLYEIPSRNGLTKPSKVRGTGHKMINMGELFANNRIYDIPMELVPLTDSEKKNCKVERNDLLFARQSLVLEGAGKCSIVMKSSSMTVFESHLIRIRLNRTKAHPMFYYYYFLSPCSPIKSIVSQCAQAGIRGSELGELYVELPPLATQRRIADILSAYDDLIDNNRKQIKMLEEAAQRLYKEWFVDLRFPGHEHTKIVDGVPEGWKPCTLDDVIEFDPKVRLDKDRVKQFVPMSALSTSSMVLDINEIIETKSNSGSKFQNGDTLLARITPCLENGKTAFVYGLESDEGAVGSTEYIVMRSKRLNPYMVYLLSRTSVFRQAAINSMSGSDGRQRVKADKLKALAYLLAPTGLIHSFEQIASPMFEMIFELNKQIFATTEARDCLLPKLMRGEVEV